MLNIAKMERCMFWYTVYVIILLKLNQTESSKSKYIDITNDIVLSKKDAVRFLLSSRKRRDLHNECCVKDCSYEERSEHSGKYGSKRTNQKMCELSINQGISCTCHTQEGSSYECGTDTCPIRGGWSNWSAYGSCTATCGTGTKRRTRSCTNPTPIRGGASCLGNTIQDQTCGTSACPISGGWSGWTAYGSCSVTCGAGMQSRTRICSNPYPAHGGSDCAGTKLQRKNCMNGYCPIHGGWSAWSPFSKCSTKCGTKEKKRRTHTCTNPAPAHGGAYCSGNSYQEESCKNPPCPIAGGWSDWTAYDSCPVTCGDGTRRRKRECSNPFPANGGSKCAGTNLATKPCVTGVTCPIHGRWAAWTMFSKCSSKCGTGKHRRTRECTNPTPAHGGRYCSGDTTQLEKCYHCPGPCATRYTSQPCPYFGGTKDLDKVCIFLVEETTTKRVGKSVAVSVYAEASVVIGIVAATVGTSVTITESNYREVIVSSQTYRIIPAGFVFCHYNKVKNNACFHRSYHVVSIKHSEARCTNLTMCESDNVCEETTTSARRHASGVFIIFGFVFVSIWIM